MAVSYIASELLLLLVHSMMRDYDLLLSTKQMVRRANRSRACLPCLLQLCLSLHFLFVWRLKVIKNSIL